MAVTYLSLKTLIKKGGIKIDNKYIIMFYVPSYVSSVIVTI